LNGYLLRPALVSALLVGAVPDLFAQAPPLLDVAPGRVTFITAEGRQAPIPQRIRVTNAGGGQLVWRARPNTPWISVTPQSGVAPAELMITVDAMTLRAGNYSGRITIDAGRVAGSPAFVDVILSLAATRPPGPPGYKVAPDKLTMRASTGQTERVSATLKVLADREPALKWTAKSDRPWLTVAPVEGTTPADLKIQAAPDMLAAGSHEGSISISGSDGKPVTRVPVVLQIAATTSALALATTMPPATLNLPYSQAIPVKGGQPPYRIQLTGGQIPPELTLINGALTGIARLPGTYTLGVTVTDSSAPPTTVSQMVTLPVLILDRNTALVIAPPAAVLVATVPKLVSEAAMVITSGSQALSWRAVSDAPWLRITPADGTAPANVTLRADAAMLGAGVYVATVTVSMDGAPNSPARIPVELTVKR
jgi:hypothetical protein